jgi:hypothetical protein
MENLPSYELRVTSDELERRATSWNDERRAGTTSDELERRATSWNDERRAGTTNGEFGSKLRIASNLVSAVQ